MEVQVVDRLPASAPLFVMTRKPRRGFALGEHGDDFKAPGDKLRIFRRDVRGARDVRARNHEEVDGTCGLMSWKATTFSSSYSFFDGISPPQSCKDTVGHGNASSL